MSSSQKSTGNIPSSQSSGTTGSPSLSPQVQAEAAARKLAKIGVSPLVTQARATRSHAQKVSSAKRKLENVNAVMRKKICLALQLNEKDVETTVERKAQDHDILMNKVKEQIPSASKIQKYKLLSIIPDSMSKGS